ncbi:DUF2510 domain-containing protein, partial [Streptomyces sp. JJ36]|uniref:DUF2510 domain-containing protein n=1 Tax=Streptomyces sp. JJ36 TaxID=2736645 RepID=UPI001F466AD8
MSSPPAGSAHGSPLPGFYPDPSIPGYIRYWNGSAWVPGTSRPEPREGEPLPEPPVTGAGDAGGPPSGARVPAARTEEPAPAEETGPVFLDADAADIPGGAADDGPAVAAAGGHGGAALPEARRGGEPVRTAGEGAAVPAGPDGTPGEALDWDDPRRLHGNRPEPATAWHADAARQSGFGDDTDHRVSWGSVRDEDATGPAPSDPRGSWAAAPGPGPGHPGGTRTDAAEPGDAAAPDGAEDAPEPGDGGTAAPQGPSTATVGIRLPRPARGPGAGRSEPTVGLRRTDVPGLPDPGAGADASAPAPGNAEPGAGAARHAAGPVDGFVPPGSPDAPGGAAVPGASAGPDRSAGPDTTAPDAPRVADSPPVAGPAAPGRGPAPDAGQGRPAAARC